MPPADADNNTENSEYKALCNENRRIHNKAIKYMKLQDEIEKELQKLHEFDSDSKNLQLSEDDKEKSRQAKANGNKALEKAIQQSDSILQKCIQHADATNYAHHNKLKCGAAKLRPAIDKFLKTKRGKCQHAVRSAIKSVGGRSRVEHVGNALTNDNRMDVFDKFETIAEYMCKLFPEESDEGNRISDQV